MLEQPGASVISLVERRKRIRARRYAPIARRSLLTFATGISLVGGVVLMGVIGTKLTPHSPMSLLVVLSIGTVAAWPLSARILPLTRARNGERRSPRGTGRVRMKLFERWVTATRHPAASRRTSSKTKARRTPARSL